MGEHGVLPEQGCGGHGAGLNQDRTGHRTVLLLRWATAFGWTGERAYYVLLGRSGPMSMVSCGRLYDIITTSLRMWLSGRQPVHTTTSWPRKAKTSMTGTELSAAA